MKEVDPFADVILFGSRARGDFHEESDWDILILTEEEVGYEYRRRMAHQTLKLELGLNICLGTVIRNKEMWKELALTYFFQQVQKDGEPIS